MQCTRMVIAIAAGSRRVAAGPFTPRVSRFEAKPRSRSGILNKLKMSSIIKARLILSNRFLSNMENVKA